MRNVTTTIAIRHRFCETAKFSVVTAGFAEFPKSKSLLLLLIKQVTERPDALPVKQPMVSNQLAHEFCRKYSHCFPSYGALTG